MLTPDTEIRLLNVPFDSSHKNQVDFSSLNAQYTWFNSRAIKTYHDFSYIKKDKTLNVQDDIDTLWAVNYCMYRNNVFPGKWIYAFVTKLEFLSENTTKLYLETDPFQTWLFQFQLMDSFVEREHEDENNG